MRWGSRLLTKQPLSIHKPRVAGSKSGEEMIKSSTHKRTNSWRSLPLRLSPILFLFLLAVPAINAQEVADTIKIRTRVVFMDALVKDKKTGVPITNLKPDNFELFDDGKPRTISYFTREGQARKPLALVLILDCREDGAGRFLKRPEVIQAITEQLKYLGPGDEVAIMAMNITGNEQELNIGKDEQRIWLTRFTNKP